MEPKGSLLCSQEPSTESYPEHLPSFTKLMSTFRCLDRSKNFVQVQGPV